MKRYQKGNSFLVLIIIVVLIALAVWWAVKSGYKLPTQTAEVNTIQDRSGLDAAGKQLDGTNLNQMDPGINQASADSTSF